MRSTSLLAILLFTAQIVTAQSNYFKLSYGFGVGPNRSYTDVYKGTIGYTAYGVFDFHVSPFATVGLEGQYGKIQGGNINTDPHNRQFANKYTSVTVNGKLMLGEIINYDRSEFLYSIRGLYAGLGVGIINNKMSYIVRYKPNTEAGYPPLGYKFAGEDKSMNIVVPISVGYNYYIYDGYGYVRYVINFNAQANYTFGEGLDGYNDPDTKFKNYQPDQYNVYSIGFKYFFGNIKSYRKTL
ncbi:hypothetical protein DHW03_10635 [Pedobacter yonginense]|uniref:Outer membrane protein beta-barrel domain-containing protein n=1 Tax=Pedobacter yonginense TaxID=651869 RepID=A0A317ES75_9SPHI|nr:hypothetical protein [Pedobacter yonginense]PWS28008.1 hypothetical protein DHW03_10635 [Pedobacter yonginense]